MPKERTPPAAKGKPNRHGTELTKREALALAFRRWTIRERAAEAKARAQSEAKSEARHKRALQRREKTNRLALSRVEACQKHPSPHAVGQLVAIAGNATMSADIRVEAADAILRIGFGLASNLPKGVIGDFSEPSK